MVQYYVLCSDNSTIIPLPSALPSALWTDNSKRLASKIILSLEVTQIRNKDTVEAYIYIYLRSICANFQSIFAHFQSSSEISIYQQYFLLLIVFVVLVQYSCTYTSIAKTCPWYSSSKLIYSLLVYSRCRLQINPVLPSLFSVSQGIVYIFKNIYLYRLKLKLRMHTLRCGRQNDLPFVLLFLYSCREDR